MKNSTQLSLYSAEQLPTLLIAHPTFKFMGLKVDKEVQLSVLHSIYIEKEDISDEPSFRSLLTIADWGGKEKARHFF